MHPMFRHPVRFHRDHRFTLAHASAYLDGELDEAGHARVERHARFCPRCFAFLASLRRTVTGLAELRPLGDEAGDAAVAAAVVARLREER